jgi:predicted RNA-binding Zn ribbon-like protein
VVSSDGSRIATVRLVGGRPALDLVNTISWRGDPARHEEHLRTAGDCLIWIKRVELLPTRELRSLTALCADNSAAAVQLLDTLRDTRDRIARHLVDPPAPELDPLARLIREALRHCRLVDDHGLARWVPPLDAKAPARLVALDLHELLTRPAGRLAVCADTDCRWAFIDTSRQHNRRWCSSADCGNRHRVRRYYQSTRQT